MELVSLTRPTTYRHPELLQAIQQPQPDHDVAARAVRTAEALVREMEQALVQAKHQLAQAQTQLQQTIPAQQQHLQLIRDLQSTQRACWSRKLSAELSGLILCKTSRYSVRMIKVSCPLLRDTANSAEPITFVVPPWSCMRIAGGGSNTFSVTANGTLYGWGWKVSGEIGATLLPTLVRGPVQRKTVAQVAAGRMHAACVTADGMVYCWGGNIHGELGVGDGDSRQLPTLIGGQLKGRTALQVAAGEFHTCCVTAHGSLFAWGNNQDGQLGICEAGVSDEGERLQMLVPTLVGGQLVGKTALQVAAGRFHTCCVTADGSMFAWGFNGEGQLGVGDTNHRPVPTLLRGQLVGSVAVQVAAGDDHSVCMTANGALFTMGANQHGQLGVGDTDHRWVPTAVKPQLLQNKAVVQITANVNHTACVTADGLLLVWGQNEDSQLGVGDDDDRMVPTLVRGACEGKTVVQVAAGGEHMICVIADGSIMTWGSNEEGQLGVDDQTFRWLPVPVQGWPANK